MSEQRFPYSPGDWIGVPLDGGWAVGLIARMSSRYGGCLGYFFGPLLRTLPNVEQLGHLKANQAIYIRQFMSVALEEGRWPILGRMPAWQANEWAMPKFRSRHPIIGRWRICEYDDELNYGPHRWASDEEVANLPEDTKPYGGALQFDLAELLGTTAPVDPSAALLAAANDPPRHFLYFHDKELADHAVDACRKLGYDPIFEESVDPQHPWLVLVRHKTGAATEDEMERAGARLAKVAEEWGGVYDGWDKPS